MPLKNQERPVHAATYLPKWRWRLINTCNPLLRRVSKWGFQSYARPHAACWVERRGGSRGRFLIKLPQKLMLFFYHKNRIAPVMSCRPFEMWGGSSYCLFSDSDCVPLLLYCSAVSLASLFFPALTFYTRMWHTKKAAVPLQKPYLHLIPFPPPPDLPNSHLLLQPLDWPCRTEILTCNANASAPCKRAPLSVTWDCMEDYIHLTALNGLHLFCQQSTVEMIVFVKRAQR